MWWTSKVERIARWSAVLELRHEPLVLQVVEVMAWILSRESARWKKIFIN